MEFEEMKKIWDAQNNEPIYGINEAALHNRILSKQKQGLHITNVSEIMGITTYIVAGLVVFGVNIYKEKPEIFLYILSAWMLASASYILVSRLRRLIADKRFDRSLRGDLNYAISVAGYQVRFSKLVRWNIIPIGLIIILGMLEAGTSIWIIAGILIFFILTMFASGWEHDIYKRRKHVLELLQENLLKEESGKEN